MSLLSSLVAKPALRLPILAATVAATVATSAPQGTTWAKADNTPPEKVHAAAGEAVEVDLDYEASESPAFVIGVQAVSVPDTTLRIELIDSRPTCTTSETFVRRADAWSPNGGILEYSSNCSSPLKKGTLTLRFVNEGDTAMSFEWLITARIGGEGSEPANGFITVRPAE